MITTSRTVSPPGYGTNARLTRIIVNVEVYIGYLRKKRKKIDARYGLQTLLINFRPVRTFRCSGGLNRVDFPTSAGFSAPSSGFSTLSRIRCRQAHLEAAPAI